MSGKRGDYCSFCGVSFPVIFVYFRSAPELNIFSGIMRLCCDFLLDCLAGDVIGFAFLSITRLGFPAARAVSARVMSSGCHRSRRIACLPYPVMSSIAVIRFAFRPVSLIALPRFAISSRLFVSDGGAMSCCGAWAACFPCPCDVITGRRLGACSLTRDVGDVDNAMRR